MDLRGPLCRRICAPSCSPAGCRRSSSPMISPRPALADRLIVLIAGQVVAQGALAEVLATPPTATAAGILGWSNLLSITSTMSSGNETELVLPCGQRLLLLPSQIAPAVSKSS